jgi:hypothetical protein
LDPGLEKFKMTSSPFSSLRILFFFFSGLFFLGAVSVAVGQERTPVDIPSEYQTLYSELDLALRGLNQNLTKNWDGKKSPTAFSVELLAANSHQGELLLREDTFQGILLTLDRLKTLGVKGIALGILYPVLKSSFPRSSEYLNFYKQVAVEIKKRGFTLIVETTTIFKEPEFANLKVDYAGFNLEQYKQEKRRMVETVIREIKPDFLTIDSEPLTQQRNTGVKLPVKDFTEAIQFVLKDLDRSKVKLGAGAGTWDSFSYFESLIKNTSLDYIDIHIYPIQRDFLWERTLRIANLAKAHGKKISVGETWLYKASEKEFSGLEAVQPQIFGRDVFEFWAPLDGKFMEVMIKLSHHLGLEFCSFFWMRYLYGYLPYNPITKDLKPLQLFQLANRMAYRNIISNNPSPSGRILQKLISD